MDFLAAISYFSPFINIHIVDILDIKDCSVSLRVSVINDYIPYILDAS